MFYELKNFVFRYTPTFNYKYKNQHIFIFIFRVVEDGYKMVDSKFIIYMFFPSLFWRFLLGIDEINLK